MGAGGWLNVLNVPTSAHFTVNEDGRSKREEEGSSSGRKLWEGGNPGKGTYRTAQVLVGRTLTLSLSSPVAIVVPVFVAVGANIESDHPVELTRSLEKGENR